MFARPWIAALVVAALLAVGVAGMAMAQTAGDGPEGRRLVQPGWMMGGGPGGMMNGGAAAGGMMADHPAMMGVDDDMVAWMEEMHADPGRMQELHDEMAADHPQMQGHMNESGMCP